MGLVHIFKVHFQSGKRIDPPNPLLGRLGGSSYLFVQLEIDSENVDPSPLSRPTIEAQPGPTRPITI